MCATSPKIRPEHFCQTFVSQKLIIAKLAKQRITLFLSGEVTLSNFLSGAESSGTSTMLNAQIVEAIRQRSYSLRPVEDSVVKRRIARKSQQRLVVIACVHISRYSIINIICCLKIFPLGTPMSYQSSVASSKLQSHITISNHQNKKRKYYH